MATTDNLEDHVSSKSENDVHPIMNIDTIIWVDVEANIESKNQQVQQQIKQVLCDVEICMFEEISTCDEYVRKNTSKSLLLITSDQLSEILTQKIHDSDNVKSIYIWGYFRDSDASWINNFAKIRGVFKEFDQIVSKIQLDRKQLEQSQQFASDFIFSFNHHGDSSLVIDGDILQFRQILDFLHFMDWTDNDFDEFVGYWTKKCSENPSNMSILYDFIDNYSIEQVFSWYTRQAFIYTALNKALRQQNIDILLHMRFFINNIYQKLALLHKDQPKIPIRVYRGQLLSDDELALWHQSINRSVLMKSFFSTTSNRDLAIFILGDTGRQSERWYNQSINSLKRVLFVIDADPSIITDDTPFADISLNSYFPEEEETLFMAGCIFRIADIDYDEKKNIHMVMLELSNINDEVKLLLAEKRKHFGNDFSLITLGHVLGEAGQLDLAENCYLKELNKMSTWKDYSFDERNIAVCHHALGNIAQIKEDYEKSIDWYEKALKENEQLLPAGHDLIADCYRSIGSAHVQLGNTDQAVEYLKIALAIFEANHGEIHPRVASCLHEIGSAYIHRLSNDKNADHTMIRDYLERALHIKQQTLCDNHPDLSITIFNLASLYRVCGQLDKALSYYKQSLEIKLKSFPESHPCVIKNYYTMATVCREKGDHESAAEYQRLGMRSEANFFRLKYPEAISVKLRTSKSPMDNNDE